LRLALVVCVLSAWLTLGVASGVARADTPSSSGAESSSQDSADAPKTPKHERHTQPIDRHDTNPPSKDPSVDRDNPPRPKPHPADPDRKTNHSTTVDTTASTASADKTETPNDPPTVTGEPPAPTSVTVAKPEGPPQPATRHTQRGSTSPSASGKPTKPVPADPPPSVNSATTSRDTVVSAPQSPTPTVHSLAAVANITPTNPPTSSTQSGVSSTSLPQLSRQFVGLVSDVGLVAASAVWTVANTFAAAFGPNSFFGVPYALATVVANSAAAVGRTLIGAPWDSAGAGPFPVNYGLIDGLTFFNPQQPPPGANDPSITVTPQHPLPIILINGTVGTQGENWGVGAPVLANAGYKVYTFNYGNIFGDPNFPIQATDDIRQSGLQLAAEVDKVLAETGAPKVILIGHSQGGGILPEYYINNLGGAAKVSQLIGIAPSNHGTDADGLVALQGLPIVGPLMIALANAFGAALEQQTVGNDFQQVVYGNGDTRPGVLYTTIASMDDEVVTPYTQQALDGPNVTNIVVQDLYPGLPVGHLGVVLSPQVWSIVLDALASNPAANPELQSNQELVA
jgi:triacylglycerol esterase/lipase EstA (alpha/beta hydrolase family)